MLFVTERVVRCLLWPSKSRSGKHRVCAINVLES